ncbi:unnamed protein product, partial [Hapterophycus canaliculatus]
VHAKVKSSEEVDFSNNIAGTKKFRSMACAIPLMSFVGNLMGVTTQAAFVQTMMPVFAGGKTGLSSLVTGGLLILSTVLRPLLPVLVPPHVSGALTVVISLRFFMVVKMVDFQRPINVLMFGMSILLIPFSFEFVDAVCITTMLGFVCQTMDAIVARVGARRRGNKVVVSAGGEDRYTLDYDGGEATAKTLPCDRSISTSRKGFRRSSSALTARRQSPHQIYKEPVSPLPARGGGGGQAVPGGTAGEGSSFRPGPCTGPAVGSLRSRFSSSLAGSSRSVNAFQAPRPPSLRPGEGARPTGAATVHWCLAFVASCQLALAAIDDFFRDDSS